MTYIPTTAELEKMGFEYKYIHEKHIDSNTKLVYLENQGFALMLLSDDSIYFCTAMIYPQSRQDIEILIRLFTKP